MDFEVLPYHWDDRARMFSDYRYLQEFYERLLRDLASQLNQIHGVDHSLRYWRILIGPWLGYFSQIIFDRWRSIEQAVATHEVGGTCVLIRSDENLVPNDMGHFTDLFVGDNWNHDIYAAILRVFGVACETKKSETSGVVPSRYAESTWDKLMQFKSVAPRIAAKAVTRASDAFFISSYLPRSEEWRLQWRLGQVPRVWRSMPPLQMPADGAQRRWKVVGDSSSEFENFARMLVPLQIPTAYLESYSQLAEKVEALPWPNRPKVIFTSASYISDDVFKMWAAEKVERGSPLVVGQHGGHDGVGLWSFVEDHGIAISDRYLSWGWKRPEHGKVLPLGQLKSKRPLGINHGIQAGALLVLAVHPRYSYFMYSTPVAAQWIEYFADQFEFVAQLPPSVQQAFTVRLYSQDWGWDQALRWQDRFPTLRLDDGQSDIGALIRRSRLYVSTYNATTFLESFNMDVPTVIFWNPKHWELRDSALPYFDDLKRVGVFHETPGSAARHVAAIWDDVDGWWSNPDVKATLARFKEQYCRLPGDLVANMEDILRDAAKYSSSEQ